MGYKPRSPAEQLHNALSAARYALTRMDMVGIPTHVLSDAEDALEALTAYVYALPDEIPDGLVEMAQCLDCPHYVLATESEPYGDGKAERKSRTCKVVDVFGCPAVKECGYIKDAPLSDIPNFLKRQAE